MDTWTDIFTDDKGVRRCRRCQHARPSKFQTNPQSTQTQNNPTQSQTAEVKK